MRENPLNMHCTKKHLVFDCDAPDDIQDVITYMISSNNEYVLDYSSLVFETWLVMHFEQMNIDSKKTKSQIYSKMRDYLGIDNYDSKAKAAPGTIASLLSSEGNKSIRSAIVNAKELEDYWKKDGKNYLKDIKNMNPSVSIHKLTERLLDEAEYACR